MWHFDKIFTHPFQGHLVVHIYFISVDTFYEIGLDFHAISRKNVNIRKLKSKAEPKTIVKPKNKETLSSPGRRGFLTSPVHSAQLILNFTIVLNKFSDCLNFWILFFKSGAVANRAYRAWGVQNRAKNRKLNSPAEG